MASQGNDDAAKRQKVSRDVTVQLSDIPDALLPCVARYLPMTSRALFAAAMTASPASWQECEWQGALSPAGRAIMGQTQGAKLDFEDVPKTLRVRLSDADLGGVLVCMDAAHTLESLKLTHCFSITGAGLKPLRGSKVMKRIDLSLVGLNESPTIDRDVAISLDVVIPILDSLIEGNESALALVHLPKKWREEWSDELGAFLERYCRLLDSRGAVCQAFTESGEGVLCGSLIQHMQDSTWMKWDPNNRLDGKTEITTHLGEKYPLPLARGVQDMTCYKCLKTICQICSWENIGNDSLGLRRDSGKMVCDSYACTVSGRNHG